MNPGDRSNTGAQRTDPGKPHFGPYRLGQFRERHPGARATATHSQRSISGPAREEALVVPHPLPQFTPQLSPVNNLQVCHRLLYDNMLTFPIRRQM